MRILLSNHQLSARSGSELAVCELARGLAARGHEVAVFTFFKGPLAEELTRDHGIRVFDDTQADQIILFSPEIVHTHHAPCAHYLRLYTMGAVRIHGVLGVLTPLEAPPMDPGAFSLALAVSEEAAERISVTPFASVRTEIFRNWFDDSKTAALAQSSWERPLRVAVISNHACTELAEALTELRASGEVEPEYFGVGSVSTVVDSNFLSRYDAVISIGRTALTAAACGRCCIMADVHGSDGLLTLENLDRVQKVNFSGRHTRTPITTTHLRQELARAATYDLAALRDRVLREFSLSARIDTLEQYYRELLAHPLQGRLDRSDWPAEGLAYAELAARVRHTEYLLAQERAAKTSSTAALASEIDTLALLLEQQAKQLAELRSQFQRYEALFEQQGSEAFSAASRQDAQVIDNLQRTLAARDEAIAWLQAELAYAKRRGDSPTAPRQTLRATLRSVLARLAQRAPALRQVVRATVPLQLREKLHRLLAGEIAPAPRKAEHPAEALLAPIGAGAALAPECFDILCFANIEWSARFQRPQHLMTQFAMAGHRVFYIVASRCADDGRPYSAEHVAHNVWQVALNTSHTPNHYADTMNDRTRTDYAAALGVMARDLGLHAPLQIVHLPFWAPLTRQLRAVHGWKISYDCMDEWDSFPNFGAPLLSEERALVSECDLLTVTSALLRDKWSTIAPGALLIRNGVDNQFFAERLKPNGALPPLPRPVIGYYGALAEWVDFELIAELADSAPDWSFVLIGDHFTQQVHLLDGKPNVHLLGLRPYKEMPRYLFHFDACIIPFKLNKITHAVDPVKFYEFLAGGKPIVSTPLAELQPFDEYVAFAEDANSFKRSLSDAIAADNDMKRAARMAFASANDWRDRFALYREALSALYPATSVIVVTFNNVELTRLCLQSVLQSNENPRLEVIVIDNASTDGTPEYLRQLAAEHDNVRIELNATNRGFAAANNQGLALARGEVLVLLNNDTIVPRGWISGLTFHLADETVALVGPVTNAVGNEAKIQPGYQDVSTLQAFADARHAQYAGRAFDIRMLAMFCLAMRRDTYERLGPLDEQFGIGMFEDDDYSMRAKAAGLRVVCAEDVYVHHFGQAAFKKLIEDGEYDALWQRNQAYFESKWGTWQPHVHRNPA